MPDWTALERKTARRASVLQTTKEAKTLARKTTIKEKREDEPEKPPRERITLPVHLIEKARDVVYFTPGLTMGSFMEDALVAQL